MPDGIDGLYHFGEDFEAILALLEDDRQLEEQFESFVSDVQWTEIACSDCTSLVEDSEDTNY